jgi:hypothetical protein
MVDCTNVVRKAAFARLCGVTRGRVSQWIAAGQIGPEAIIGEGRFARIDVALAKEHLRLRLGDQRYGWNGLNTKLGDGPAPAPRRPGGSNLDSIEAQMKAEKLQQAQFATKRAEEADRLRRGIYIFSRDASAENVRTVQQALDGFEAAIADFAEAFSSANKIPQRDVRHLLRKQMRKFRERIAAEAREAAASMPETVDDDDEHLPEGRQ